MGKIIVVGVWCLLFCGGACSGGEKKADNKAGSKAVLARDLVAVAKQWSDARVYEIRYNPPRCNCQPIEVLLEGRWYRIFLQAASRDSEIVEEFLDQALSDLKAQQYRTYFFSGELESDLRECQSGHLHLTGTVESFHTERPQIKSEGMF